MIIAEHNHSNKTRLIQEVSRIQSLMLHPLMLLISSSRSHFWWLSLSIIAAVEEICMTLITPYLFQSMTDLVVAKLTEDFLLLILLAGLLLITDACFTKVGRSSLTSYTTCTVHDLRNRVTAFLQKLPISYHESHHTGDLVSRLNADVDILAAWLAILPSLISLPLMFVAGFIYIFTISWKLLIVSTLTIPISGILFGRLTKSVETSSRRQAEGEGLVNSALQDILNGMSTAKSYNSKDLLCKKYQALVSNVLHHSLQIHRQQAISNIAILGLRCMPQLFVTLYGGHLAFIKEITIGQLLAVNLLIWLLFVPIEEMLSFLGITRETIPAAERVFSLLNQAPELIEGDPYESVSESAALQFENVCFGYTQDELVLKNVNFTIQAGQTVAIVGPSGCGKSTLLKLICGFYHPNSGHVRICGNDVAKTNPKGTRSQISLVPQEPYLFPTTIIENIAYGRPYCTEEDIISAAKMANADHFINTLPEGYQTTVAERGVNLSGGQRQRIALARAILKEAPILLLDEPTSALDTQSELVVQDGLKRFSLGRTIIIVAHRLSTIKLADNVLVLNQGSICERGTHDNLMQHDTLYRRLYLQQERRGDIYTKEVENVV